MDFRSTEESASSYSEIDKLHMKFNEKIKSMSRLLEEKDRLHQIFCEERRNWKRDSRKHILEVLAEQEMSNSSLEAMKKHFDSWSKELDKREAFVNRCRKILVEEEKKNDVTNSLLQRASTGQKKEDKNDSRLVEEHQREEALEKPQEPGLLEAKERLNMEIENLKEKLYWGRYYKRKRKRQILEPTLSHGNSPA